MKYRFQAQNLSTMYVHLAYYEKDAPIWTVWSIVKQPGTSYSIPKLKIVEV